MQARKQQLELDIEQQTGSRKEKEYVKAVYCHAAYLTYMQRNTGLEEAQAGMEIAGRNLNNLRYADDTTLMAESEKWKWSCSVMPDSQRLHGLQPTRLLRPWNLPGKSI